jgi:acyl carrier protein
MNASDVRPQLTSIFRDVFDDPELELRDQMTAADVEEWDSLSHIRLIVSVEQAFNIQFSMAEIEELKNVGEFVSLITRKL